MSTDHLLKNLPSLASIIDRQPLTVHPDMLVVEAITMMNQSAGSQCLWPNSSSSNQTEISLAGSSSSLLISENNQLVGIFTERDLVKIAATQIDLQGIKIGEVKNCCYAAKSTSILNIASTSVQFPILPGYELLIVGQVIEE